MASSQEPALMSSTPSRRVNGLAFIMAALVFTLMVSGVTLASLRSETAARFSVGASASPGSAAAFQYYP
jgi:hypothetical protein